MNSGKLTVIIFGAIGGIIALLLCWLGISIFLQQTDTYTITYFFAGIEMKGKTFGAVLTWIGLILLYFSLTKTIKYLKAD